MSHLKFRSLLLSAALTLAACGPGHQAVDPHYPGSPLFTVQGQMELHSGATAPANPIRLAVAWYPDQTNPSGPKGIATQDVQYQGTFPLNYSFSFYSAPPPDAFTTIDGVKIAWGLLEAYDDKNGNGTLDIIAKGGSPIDQVLGTSMGDYFNGDGVADPTWVVYVDGTPPQSWGQSGYQAGYNLVNSQKVVPPTTKVRLPLQGTNELNFFVCDAIITGTASMNDACDIPPTGGVRVEAGISRVDGITSAWVHVTDGKNPLTQATVEVNGHAIPYDASQSVFTEYGTQIPFTAPGANEVKVTVPGQAPRTFRAGSVGEFAIDSPTQGTRIEEGAPVALAWSAAPDATWYALSSYSPSGATELTRYVQGNVLSATLPGLSGAGYHSLQVYAYNADSTARGQGGSWVSAGVGHNTYVDVIPANTGLAVGGSLTLTHGSGQLYSSAWLSAFDGVTPLSNATVRVNGVDLAWDAQYQMFAKWDTTSFLSAGVDNTIVVQAAGKADLTTTVRLPGDFSITSAPTSVKRGEAIPLAWTASAGADGYSIIVYDAQSKVLYNGMLQQGTTASLPDLGVTGDVFIYVGASKTAADPHLSSSVQNLVVVTVNP